MAFFDSTRPKSEYQGPALRFTDWYPGVFLKPAYLFQTFRERGPRASDWLMPVFLLSLLSGILFSAAFFNPAYQKNFTQLSKEVMAEQLAQGKTTPVEVERGAYYTQKVFQIVGPIIFPLGCVILTVISALLFWLFTAIVGGVKTTYKLMLSLQGPIFAAVIPGVIISQIVMAITGVTDFSLSIAQLTSLPVRHPAHTYLAFIEPFFLYGFFVTYVSLITAVQLPKKKALVVTILTGIIDIAIISLI